MLLLAIESSTQICASALVSENKLLAECKVNLKNVHAAMLFPIVHSLFATTGFSIKDIDAVAVSIGPGSFTGLRIGLSAAKGIAMGNDIPIVAVPTLEALALQAPIAEGRIYAILKSRADEYYCAVYERSKFINTLIQEPAIKKRDELLDELPSSALLIGDIEAFENSGRELFLAPKAFCMPSAQSVALIGRTKFLAGKTEDIRIIEPDYHQQFIAGKPRKSVLHA